MGNKRGCDWKMGKRKKFHSDSEVKCETYTGTSNIPLQEI